MSKLNLIEAYLENKLTTAEKLDLEHHLQQDANLNAEFQLQSEIIGAIKKARETELKEMLNKVEVPPTGNFALGSVKVISMISLLALLGAGSYFFFGTDKPEGKVSSTITSSTTADQERNAPIHREKEDSDTPRSDSHEHIVPTSAPEEELPNVADQHAPAIPTTTDNGLPDKEGTGPTVQRSKSKKEQSTGTVSQNTLSMAEENTNRPLVDPAKMAPSFIHEEQLNNNAKAPGTSFIEEKGKKISKIEISTDNSQRKYSFHYKLTGNELKLFGDFDKGIYEILEFNSSGSKHLYLFYAGDYYLIEKGGQKISPLKRIRDAQLADSLSAIKDNRH